MVPVVKLLGARLAAEVPSHAAKLPGQGPFAELIAVVAADALQTQPPDEVLLIQELAAWEGRKKTRKKLVKKLILIYK